MRIQHNVMAMNAYRNYSNNTSALSKNLERLSSGYKINRAGDDAAGLAISEKMRAQITGLEAAQKNVKDGTSLVNTAEGAMQEIQDMLNRMVYLATQSSNGTYDDEVDRKNLQQEVDQLKEEINRIADSANFNGIKLLDGSLGEEELVDKIEVTGIVAEKSLGTVGKYDSAIPITAPNKFVLADGTTKPAKSGMSEGDTYEYTVTLDDDTSYTVKLELKRNADNVLKLTAEDGTEYNTTLTGDKFNPTIATGDDASEELDAAILSELKKTALKDNFTISNAKDASGADIVGQYLFTAKEKDGLAVRATDCAMVFSTGERVGSGNLTTAKNAGVKVTQHAMSDGYEIAADSITEYNGTNYEDAVFEINGHKFLLLSETLTGDVNSTDGTGKTDEALRTMKGFDDDVTILIGGIGGLMSGATSAKQPAATGDAANYNFAQNIKTIAEVTGLNVTDAIDEVDADGNAAPTGVSAGAGIRLSLANKTLEGNGLVLQIGDTSESFNQLKVTIKDMHTKSLGIDGIDISTSKGAQSAIDVIKNAINTVSAVRGKLGAISNRLDHTANNLSVMRENITDAESAIRDTDIAEEMMSYTKNNILVQSAQAMLAQANQVPQGVLQLLQ